MQTDKVVQKLSYILLEHYLAISSTDIV